VLQNTRQSIWTSSLCPATLQNVFFMLSMQVGTLPALSPDKRNRSSFMTLNTYSQHDLVSMSDDVRWRYTAQAVPVIYSQQFYRTRYLWITYSEAVICLPAADRIQTAARQYLKKINSIMILCVVMWAYA
jgi:hypothetical protein